MRRSVLKVSLLCVFATGCGELPAPAPVHTTNVLQALKGAPEMLELEPLTVRQELFRQVSRASLQESGRVPGATVPVFPMASSSGLQAAAGFEGRLDFFQSPDGGEPLGISVSAAGGERWPEDPRDSLQGRSERDAAELLARNLASYWGLKGNGALRVDRAVGAPYAVAYADGVLRVNPSFLYMAAAIGMSPVAP